MNGKGAGLTRFLNAQLAQPKDAADTAEPKQSTASTATTRAEETTGVTDSVSSEVPDSSGTRVARQVTKTRRASSVAPPSDPEPMSFEDYERKEARLRLDQISALDALERRLTRSNRGLGGPRVTANTLIRVAVDLLLEHERDLQGANERELLDRLRRLVRSR